MKKTVYFTSKNHQTGALGEAMKSATDMRDEWLNANKNNIGKIESEDIKIVLWHQHNQNVFIIIVLTYHSK